MHYFTAEVLVAVAVFVLTQQSPDLQQVLSLQQLAQSPVSTQTQGPHVQSTHDGQTAGFFATTVLTLVVLTQQSPDLQQVLPLQQLAQSPVSTQTQGPHVQSTHDGQAFLVA